MRIRDAWRRWTTVLLAATAAACGGSGDGGSGGTPNPPAAPAIQSVAVTPATAALDKGQTVSFAAVARDAGGNAVSGATFTWSTSDATIATIASDGTALGIAAGTVTVRASSAGVMSNGATLTVNDPAVSGATSEELIAAALAAGEIDAETALVYRAFANFGDARLPAKYTGARAEAFEAPVVDEVLAAFDTLSGTAQAQLAPFLMRPSSIGSWLDPNPPAASLARSAGTSAAAANGGLVRPMLRPGCLGSMAHWTSVDPLSVPVRVWYDTRETGHAAVAATVANEMETKVWPTLIGTLGFKAPLDDVATIGCDGGNSKLDIYIVRPDSMDELGRTFPENLPSYDRNRSAVHIRIKSSLDPIVLRQTIAHEFAHAIHYAYPTAASQPSYGWFRDGFANWAALQVYPGNLGAVYQGSCLTATPETPLDDTSVVKCPNTTKPISRQYGTWMPLEAISWKRGPVAIRQILEGTATASSAFEAMDLNLKSDWPLYAQALWNQDPIDQRTDSYRQRHNMTDVPVLAKDQPNPIDANLNGKQADETVLDANVNNMAVKFYRFTFSDPATRSLMFHNTWRENRRQGQRVSVYALYKPEGKPWGEEDWSDYEWIGFCRDFKDQRLEALVVIVASAEWSGSNPVVKAAQPPKLMRNNIGCWGFAGTAKRLYSSQTWNSGETVTTFDTRFDYHPTGTPPQYTDLSTGRLRVPVAAPLFAGGALTFTENYVDSPCSYSASLSTSESTIVLGGNSAATIIVNNFLESLPDDLRVQQEQVTGTAPGAYLANGVTDRMVTGSVSGDDTCGTSYTTAVGAWLLTRETAAASPIVATDGHLRGSWTANKAGDNFTEIFEWDLAPLREP